MEIESGQLPALDFHFLPPLTPCMSWHHVHAYIRWHFPRPHLYFSTSSPFPTPTSLSPDAGKMRSLTLSAYIPRAKLAIARFATPQSHEVIVRHLSVSPREAITEDARRRIYIDNAGNQAIFFTFFLRRAGLPVTLLVHRQERLEQFERAGRK